MRAVYDELRELGQDVSNLAKSLSARLVNEYLSFYQHVDVIHLDVREFPPRAVHVEKKTSKGYEDLTTRSSAHGKSAHSFPTSHVAF